MIDWTNKKLVSETQLVIRLVSGKWDLPILAALQSRPRRYNDLQREIGPAIRSKVFVDTLQRLVELELIEREVQAVQKPPAVYYALSPAALSLLPSLLVILEWTDANRVLVQRWRHRS